MIKPGGARDRMERRNQTTSGGLEACAVARSGDRRGVVTTHGGSLRGVARHWRDAGRSLSRGVRGVVRQRVASDSIQSSGPPLEIIGVAKDAKHHVTDEGAEPYIYQPIGQQYQYSYYGGGIVVYVRTRRDPAGFMPTVASLIRSLDPEVPFRQSTMAETLDRYALPSRIASAFIGLFGGLGLLLAAVGLSGALAYSVARRAKEIGVRMALGADRANVLRMIIGEGLALTSVGVVIGLSLALALTRARGLSLRRQFGRSAHIPGDDLDPDNCGAAGLLLSRATSGQR